MKAIKSQNSMKQLIIISSMLLFLFVSAANAQDKTDANKEAASSETFSLQGNANPSLFAVITSKMTAELNKAMPVPFEETMLISYSFPKAMDVDFTIYDKNGRELKNLVRENKAAGSYSVNLEQEKLKAGIYYYKLVIGEDVEVKKILLVK
jgi:hypothetical protein